MTFSRPTISIAIAVIVAATTASGGDNTKVRDQERTQMKEVISGRLMVKVKGADHGDGKMAMLSDEQMARISNRLSGAAMIGGLRHGGWTLWQIPENMNPRAAAKLLSQEADVAAVEPLNKVYTVTLPVPNDPDWAYIETSSTYVLDFGSSGTGSGGTGTGGGGSTAGFRRLWNLWDVNAVTADTNNVVSGGWAVYPGTWYTGTTKPADCPIIAFVDTGLDMNHPDFINAGGTGTDISTGGQIMTSLSGYFNNGQLVPGGDPTDLNGHGTHVTGIAIAAGNNGSFNGDGMIGIGYNSRGMILRVFDSAGNASDNDAAAAIEYAADNGAAIINCSLGTTNYSQVFQDAVTYAFQKGSLVVCAGNENGSGGGNLGPIYPAACSGALGVTANAPGQYPADDYYAGYGNYVGIAAPGGDLVVPSTTEELIQYVYSTACRYPCELSGDSSVVPAYTLNYTYLVGTSMACPHVSGAAGLYYGQNNMHQADGFANLKAFQAIQVSALPTAAAPNGGWEPTQGFGSLDVQGLLSLGTNSNPRNATVGDVVGIVYYGGTPTSNVTVTATAVTAPFNSYQTTTFADGTYRFDPFPPGVYDIKASPFGTPKTKRVQVAAGCDMPGVDFFVGPAISDPTPPVIARFNYVSGNQNTMIFNQWAYDPESEIDTAIAEIGSAPGGSNIMAPKMILPGQTQVTLSGFKLPAYYYVTFNYTNGIGNTSQGQRYATPNVADCFVQDVPRNSDHLYSHIDVKAGATGMNEVAYIAIDISKIGATVEDTRLTLTGSAYGTAVPVGAYGTNNSAWTESGITWANAPKISGAAVDEQSVSAENNYTWNITSLVQAAKTAGLKTCTVALKCDATTSAGAYFGSRRAKIGPPIVSLTAHS